MSSLRINSNLPSLNSHRQVLQTDMKVSKSFEKTSSGLRINRAADNPAGLVVSEKLRNYIASVTQAVDNNQQAISMVQTAEAAMEESNKLLIRMKQLAIHASNEGANDPDMLEADMEEYKNAARQLDRIAKNTSFGSNRKALLDGTSANQGITLGVGLSLIDATEYTQSSSDTGFEVIVSQTATKNVAIGADELSQDIIDDGELLKIHEGGKNIELRTQEGDTALTVAQKLDNLAKEKGLNVTVRLSDNEKLVVESTEFGSKSEFLVSSTTEGILSEQAETLEVIRNGIDIRGTIDGEVVDGDGQLMIGKKGSKIEGLVVKYEHRGDEPIEEDNVGVGGVYFKQNSLNYQVGGDYGQTQKIEYISVFSTDLGRNVDNSSGYKNLADVDLRTFRGAQDAILLLNKASADVSLNRSRLGAIQRNALEHNNMYLRTTKENLVAAESSIRDTDMAEEISTLTREQVKRQASMAILAQANQNPQSVMALLN